MKLQHKLIIGAAALTLLGATLLAVRVSAADEKKAASAGPAPKPALSVTTTQPQPTNMPLKIAANGNITAWQEASIGTEANGLRLAEVRVNVGDVVKRGQVLAVFTPDMVQADVTQMRASIAEAEATLAEASANAQRARELQATGALSAQQISQYLTTERTAQARLEWQRSAARTQQLRLQHTQVLAPDHGVISARSATVGAVLPAGQELFRLIRQGRLEWRAEVPAIELARVKPGMSASVVAAGAAPAPGAASTTRTVSPSARKPPPAATTRAFASRPPVISMRSPTRRPACTFVSLTFESAPTRNT